MVDIPPINPVASGASQSQGQAGNVVAVLTNISSASDKIQQIIRQIQVNATVTEIPGDGTVTLTSPLGSLTVLLPQIVDADQQKLLQQLLNLNQTQKPVTIVVQPGNPPTQAVLLLPTNSSAASTANLQQTAQTSQTAQTGAAALQVEVAAIQETVASGTILTAVVLPPSNIASQLSSLPQQQVGALPQGAEPITPPLTGGTQVPGSFIPGATLPGTQTQGIQGAALPLGAAPIAGQPLPITPNLIPEIPNALIFQTLATEAEIENDQFLNLAEKLPPNQDTVAEVTSPQSPQVSSQQSSPLPSSLSNPSAFSGGALSGAASGNIAGTPLGTSSTQSLQTSSLFQTGNEVTLRVNAVIPPEASALNSEGGDFSQTNLSYFQSSSPSNLSQNITPSSPNQVIATVTATGPNGQAILKVGDTTLYVRQSIDVPVGTNLLVSLSQGKGGTLTPLQTPDIGNLQNIQQTLQTLAQINPQLAQAVLDGRIPQPGPSLPGALLFFMSAVKQGEVRSWLGGDAMDALTRAGKFELLAKLTNDLTSSGQTVRDGVVGDWKSYPLPIFNNNQFQIINFYVHGDGQRQGSQAESSSPSKSHTRFLIDLRLSQLGALQLDGFIQAKKLDMMIRSEHALPGGLHNELRSIYLNALSAADYVGSINFQVGRQHWMVVQPQAKSGQVVT